MAVKDPTGDVPDWRIRACPDCGGEREHEVTVRFRTEATREAVQPKNEMFARQPYRLLKCYYCGASRSEQVV
ncbi:hypothetical protein NDI76_17385 [Halogeometricum sp. S1BR25-6]|uniref:DUF7835 domain-containing protein n=1 Tax=Halogeometricum salsisoli TaxID=2950536 RepID=A0ABU2GI78_9EURY|nr:hypothetical protein [Halogeometricum sp. S1BR25-6]MDS0300525.1 hypothetical protein [Halogeometricum sp. S1BR25-6]